jgi:hypothetical protein
MTKQQRTIKLNFKTTTTNVSLSVFKERQHLQRADAIGDEDPLPPKNCRNPDDFSAPCVVLPFFLLFATNFNNSNDAATKQVNTNKVKKFLQNNDYRERLRPGPPGTLPTSHRHYAR